ncbi:restriction endonuclease subunit S [Polaromonas sp. JS666]|uniref:restriction endonuclease subunit S n=1 Tax=Polaromonas sp. (strain JS666 / ATCC BAA-500) TaxID=296591 RepID=UPI000053427A|nr:restriction endonuclease subunit S [Polaromonas sp. JS666]ABE43872.1 Restriction endonuclease S subunits-like protein [Polaromonas sp. JS666]
MSSDVSWQRQTLKAAGISLIDCDHRTPPAANEGYPYIAIPQLKNGHVSLDGVRRISPEDYLEWTKKLKPQTHDVIVVRRCNSGDSALIPPGLECAIGQNLVILRSDGKTVQPQFLRWLLNGPDWWEQVSKFINVGAVFDSLRCRDIPNFELTIPPIDDQREIAIVLDALDDRIALLREINTTLEAIAQALFKSWFVDFDPVRAKMEGRVPEGMDEATAALFPDGFEESELGLVPRGWTVDRLDTWLSVLETGRRPKGGVGGISDGVPSIGAESIVRIGQFDFGKTKYVSHDFFANMKSGALISHDVLLYKDGGKPGVFLPRVSMFGDDFPFERCGINEHVFRMRLKAPFNQPFLYFWLWSDAVMHELKHRGGKAAIPGINQSDVREQELSVPNASVLNRFDELVSPLVGRIFSNAKQAQTLATLRDTLLPRLISGQLRLLEVEDDIVTAAA